jgi:uncharacterized protein
MYAGTIRHRRFAVREHAFSYRIALAYRDLDTVRGFLTRAEVSQLVGAELTGPIRLLAAPRSLGIRFNPVSFYYCFEGGELCWIVAEVTNTPWGERHSYVLGPGGGTLEKALHVSPFMAMDHTYDVRATVPDETLSMHIESRRDGMLAFDATLNLRRRPYRRRALFGASLRTLALIYAHGLVLKLKGVPYHSHPEVS